MRPGDVRLKPDPESGWRGKVDRVEPHSDYTVMEIQVDGGRFLVREDGERRYEVGDRVSLSMAPDRLHVFDERGLRLNVV